MFNKKLYIEGLRQTFLIGIFMLVISTIINCFYPLNILITGESMTNFHYNSEANQSQLDNTMQLFKDSPEVVEVITNQFESQRYKQSLEMEWANGSMLVLMFIIPMVIIFTQFKFLNTRKSCDFYHSIPVTRLALVVNLSLASLTWIFLCITIPMLCNGLIYSYIDSVEIYYAFLLPEIVEKVIIAFLIYASLLIGIAISGQVITACAVSGLVLFLPRFFVTMLIFYTEYMSGYINNGEISFTNTIGNHLNLLVRKFTSLPDAAAFTLRYSTYIQSNYELEKLSYNLNAYIYTFCLALALFAIGCHLFTKRPSEMAGKNTANAITQHVIRITLVIPIIIFMTYFYAISGLSTYYFSIILIMAIIALIIYLSFELITTRSMKKLIKAITMLPIVVVFAIGYYGIIVVSSNVILSQSKVNVQNIKSVNLDFVNRYVGSNNYNHMYDSHTLKLISDYDITNEQIIELVANELNDHVDSIKNNTNRLYQTSSNNIQVTFNTKSSTEKLVQMQNEVLEQIFDILLTDETINTTLLSTLPDKSTIASGQLVSFYDAGADHYSPEQTQKLVDVFYNEYNTLTLDQQLQVVYHNNYNYFSDDMNSYNYYSTSNKQNKLYSDFLNKSDFAASSYNSNDYLSTLALYTKDNQTKYIYLSDLLPETKKLIVDMYIEENKDGYTLLNYFVNNYNNDYFKNFAITSFDDYYTLKANYFDSYYTGELYNLDQELLDVFATSLDRVANNNLDYENLYVITLQPSFTRQSQAKSTYSFNQYFVILPFTQSEFETHIANIADYTTLTSQ